MRAYQATLLTTACLILSGPVMQTLRVCLTAIMTTRQQSHFAIG